MRHRTISLRQMYLSNVSQRPVEMTRGTCAGRSPRASASACKASEASALFPYASRRVVAGTTATGAMLVAMEVGNAGTLEPLHTVPVSEATPAFAAWTEAEI